MTNPTSQSLEYLKQYNFLIDLKKTFPEVYRDFVADLEALIASQVAETVKKAQEIVEEEYHKLRTVGRQDEDYNTRLFIDVAYRHNLKHRLAQLNREGGTE